MSCKGEKHPISGGKCLNCGRLSCELGEKHCIIGGKCLNCGRRL